MIKISQLVLKIIVLLVFIISGTYVFSQKASFSVYNLIPEFMDVSPIKKERTDTMVIKAESTVNYPDTSTSKELVNDINSGEWMNNKKEPENQEISEYHIIIAGWVRKSYPWINNKSR